MAKRAPEYSIILAAGSGKRMKSPDLHKVCFPIRGVPAISRALRTYTDAGVQEHVVVVGDKAGQVMDAATASEENVIFTYQREQIGTADAARCGMQAVPAAGERDVLIVAGDKVLEPELLSRLFELYYSDKCDFAFVTGKREFGEGLCRIIKDDEGTVVGNVEAVDVAQRRTLARLKREVEAAAASKGESSAPWMTRGELRKRLEVAAGVSKAAKAFECIWDLASGAGDKASEEPIEPGELLKRIPDELTRFEFRKPDGSVLTMTPDEVDETPCVNQSIYVVSTTALEFAMSRLEKDNAQKEEYLSDIMTILSREERPGGGQFTVRALHAEDRHAVMAFNNPDELLEIEDYLQRRERAEVPGADEERPAAVAVRGRWVRSIGSWRAALAALNSGEGEADEIASELRESYTDSPAVIRERAELYETALSHAEDTLGRDAEVLIVRSPGRVNLLGRHVDHQGGNCNLMTIGYETVMVVHPRDDDEVRLFSVEPDRFPDHAFSIGDLVARLPWDDWLSVVNSEAVLDMARKAQGNWSQYVVASAVRLQKLYTHRKLRGADLVVAGDIPQAAGLSSSSSLVVAAAEALIEVNGLDVVPNQLVDLAGEGEWFVGTRGGSADHAAIKLGEKQKVVKVSFFPFEVQGVYDFPTDSVLAVCNSGIKAHKSSGARDQFNHRVSCYRIGFTLIRKFFPQYEPLLEHLRDVNTRNLRVPLARIYEILLSLPEQASRDELRKLAGDESLEPFFETHAQPEDGLYPVRGVVLFGLGECARSRLYGDLLEKGRIDEIGRLMQISHDGDRVSRLDENGEMGEYQSPTSDRYLNGLIADLESQEPERVLRAQLERQPGSYRCSLPDIDRMVDLAAEVPGVAGAQLAGAGLGGCMMVLVERDQADALNGQLTEKYYKPAGKEPDILWCEPVAGSGVLLKG